MYNYKIRHKKTRLYSNGSTYAVSHDGWGKNWSECGKIWQDLDKLRAHLNNIIRKRGIPEDWEIVEVYVQEHLTMSPSEVIKPEVLMKMLARAPERFNPEW